MPQASANVTDGWSKESEVVINDCMPTREGILQRKAPMQSKTRFGITTKKAL